MGRLPVPKDLQDLFAKFMPAQAKEPRYRYWTHQVARGAKWNFGYTTTRCLRNERHRTRSDEPPGFLAYKAKWTKWYVPGVKRKWTRGEDVPEKHRHRARQDRIITKEVRFGRRWKAKDRAYKWYCEAAGLEFRSLHTPRPPGPGFKN